MDEKKGEKIVGHVVAAHTTWDDFICGHVVWIDKVFVGVQTVYPAPYDFIEKKDIVKMIPII